MRHLLVFLVFFIAASGFCTGVYEETGPNHVPGLIQEGDVFTYYCELPDGLSSSEELEVFLSYPNGDVSKQLLAPRLVFGVVVLFP